jgi:ABC-type multidrug transport system ATPase subunit
LIGLLNDYQGRVTVLGKDLRAWDRTYYRRIGVAFEAPNHFYDSPRERTCGSSRGCTAV